LFGEDHKEAEQVRIAMVMLQGKTKVWWGQVKMDHGAREQPLMKTLAKFKQTFIVQYMPEDYYTHIYEKKN
jgi:hypothetical protein